MADDNHLFSVPCYDGTMLKQDYYNEFFEMGQQKINFSFSELSLPDDDPVYTQTYVSNDRTDYDTLIPVLEKHKNAFGEILEEVTALQRLQIQSKMSL